MTPPPDTETVRARLRALLPDLRARYAVRSLAIFGSYARGEQTPESDLDVLVEFDDTPDLYRLGGVVMDLKDGTDLDVHVTYGPGLRPQIRASVERDLLPVG